MPVDFWEGVNGNKKKHLNLSVSSPLILSKQFEIFTEGFRVITILIANQMDNKSNRKYDSNKRNTNFNVIFRIINIFGYIYSERFDFFGFLRIE